MLRDPNPSSTWPSLLAAGHEFRQLGVLEIQEPFQYDEVASIEAEFAKINESAVRLAAIAKRLSSEARSLDTASTSGNLAAIGKARNAIALIATDARDLFETIGLFREDPLARAVGTRRFLMEVLDVAEQIGLGSARLSGLSILAFPNRLTVDEKGIKLGRKTITSVRPSALARLLKVDADKARRAPAGFIEALKDAYEVKSPSSSTAVPLAELYHLLTLMPEMRRAYSELDFVRDLSIIDAYGPHVSRDGKRLTFVASTSTRMGKGYRSVSPSGDEVTYNSIRFIDPA